MLKFKGIALDLLFPSRCLGCGKEGSFICASCQPSLVRLEPPYCPGCGKPEPAGCLCPGCLEGQAIIDGIRAPFVFTTLIRKAIHELKYQNLRALASPLAQLLHEHLAANPLPADILVPVPLHKKRLRERGYNQSELIARELSRTTGLPLNTDCLIREHYALPQARTASVAERRANVSGAFICRNTAVKDRQVLLVDDVTTSGTTLDAAAAALKKAGASSVWGLIVAREI